MAVSLSSSSSSAPSASADSSFPNLSSTQKDSSSSGGAQLTSHTTVGHVNGVLEQPLNPSHPEGQSSSLSSAHRQDGAQKDPVSEHPTRVDRKEEQTIDNDKPEVESMSPTLTANKPASTNDNASSSVKANAGRPTGTRSSRGFFSKLFRILVPCASPSPTHPIEIDVPISPQSSPSKPDEQPALEAKDETPQKSSPKSPPAAPLETLTSETDNEFMDEPEKPVAVVQVEETTEIVHPTTPTLLPQSETEGLTSGAVQAPGSTGRPPSPEKPHHDDGDSDRTSFTEDELEEPQLDEDDDEDRLILNGGAGIPIGPDGVPRPLLPPISPQHAGRKCLVLDLDETLVHSSFKSIQQADYVVPVEIEYHWHNVYVIKRPGVDNFLKKMGEIYEVVVFTASLSKYADPVLDKLDIHQVVAHRLFRESCYNHKGNYVKDLSQLGRPISDTIILDNSPASYIFHPNNAVPVSSWFNDPHDTELTDLVPFLTDLASVDDVRGILDGAR